MGLGLADGRVNHGFCYRNAIDQLRHAQAFGFLGEVDRLAVLQLVSTFAFADDAAEQTIRKSLANLQLDTPIESISASPMAGLYEVKLKGSRVLYASADGQFIVQGYMFQLKDGKPVNLTEHYGFAVLPAVSPRSTFATFSLPRSTLMF